MKKKVCFLYMFQFTCLPVLVVCKYLKISELEARQVIFVSCTSVYYVY